MRRLFCLAALVLLLSFGCKSNVFESLSDDSSSEADIERAQMALNDGDYQEAIDILEPGYDASNPDAEAARILASAYMGKAGIDLTYILQNSDSSEGQSFDVITSALSLDITEDKDRTSSEEVQAKSASGTPKYIDYDSIDEFLDYLESSQTYLAGIVTAFGNDDDKVQLGMVSAVHFILKTGLTVADLNGLAADYNVPINKEAYREVFPVGAGWQALLTSLAGDIDGDAALVASLQADIRYVSNGVTVLLGRTGDDEDLADEFNDFLTELLGGGDIDDFSGTEVAAYIQAHLLGYEL